MTMPMILQVCSTLYPFFHRHFVFKNGNNYLLIFPNCGLEVLNNITSVKLIGRHLEF